LSKWKEEHHPESDEIILVKENGVLIVCDTGAKYWSNNHKKRIGGPNVINPNGQKWSWTKDYDYEIDMQLAL